MKGLTCLRKSFPWSWSHSNGWLQFDLKVCTNSKWLNLINLFDLTQLVSEPTRITQTSATLIDHVYASHPENIVHCTTSSISLSDHFPVCFTRKINSKLPKHKHITTSYRCFKHFNESYFISELTNDLSTFVADKASIGEDFTSWSSLVLKHLNNYAPVKSKRVKTKRLRLLLTLHRCKCYGIKVKATNSEMIIKSIGIKPSN